MILPVPLLSHGATAAEIRARADRLVSQKRFTEASAAFLEASRRYAALGDPNAGQILRDYSRRYRTDARLFVDDAPSPPRTLARNEPEAGCDLGANVEREDGADRDPHTFDVRTRDHATFFIYLAYGRPFPTSYARRLKRLDAGLQIAWEPRDLQETLDGEYLDRFMRSARDSGIPIFLRFASEMNGNWTSYHGDPTAYREAFRRVAAVAHALAPNAAMVWCPADSPEKGVEAYYPGADAVDWVGVNFYSVRYNDGDRGRAAEWRHPEDSLAYLYGRYAGRHPMMVGEWAATHRSVVDGVARPEFARDKIAQLYAAVPRLYPRVKAIHWLSLDTIRYAQGSRRLNDFTLLDEPSVASAYVAATAEPFYLGKIGDAAPVVPRAVGDGDRLERKATFSAYVRSYVARPRTLIQVDGRTILDETVAGPHRVETLLSSGRHRITLTVFDDEGLIAGRQSVSVGTLRP